MLKKLRCWMFGHPFKPIEYGDIFSMKTCEHCKKTIIIKKVIHEKIIDDAIISDKPTDGEDARQEE